MGMFRLFVIVAALVFSVPVMAENVADIQLPGIGISLDGAAGHGEVATALKILLAITVLSLAPAMLVVMTSFTRIIIVLSILRHALGMQQTPPNTVLISLALFLTLFNMLPVFSTMNEKALQPYLQGQMGTEETLQAIEAPMRDFMIRQTREKDLALMLEISKTPRPDTVEDTSMLMLIPAFMFSEIQSAFRIGFIIFLPFLLIDIVVASILMSMGMMMVPPMMISLPVKIMMFVLIDGWNLVAQSLLESFH